MPAKRVLFGEEGRARLLRGSRVLAGAVKATLGPGGRNVLLERPMHSSPLVTKDGVTVAEHIELQESFANMGAQLVLESAVKTGNTAGDGTTTATVIAHVIYREGVKPVAAGYHPLALKRGIDIGVERAVAALVKMSKQVTGTRDVEKVARTGKPLLVVGEVSAEALSLLVVNKLQGTMKVCAILPPFYSETRRDALGDLAAQVGGRVIGEEPGIALADVTLQDLGRAKKIIVDQEKTTFVGGATDKAALEARIQQINALYADTNSEFKHMQLEQRLRRMVGGAALIRVGGTTDAETRERKLRFED